MQPQGNAQRINELLQSYWEELRGDQPYPKEKDIALDKLESIWDSCFLVKHDESVPTHFAYVYLGSDLIAAYGDDLNEREICERLVFPSTMSLLDKFNEVVETKAPVMQDSAFTNTQGLEIKFRSVMLPLGNNDDDDVGFVIGGMRWKSYL